MPEARQARDRRRRKLTIMAIGVRGTLRRIRPVMGRGAGLPGKPHRSAGLRLAAALTALVVLSYVVGCSGPAAPSRGTRLSRFLWVLGSNDLATIEKADPRIASMMLAGSGTYVLEKPGSDVRHIPGHGVPTAFFTSYHTFIVALHSHEIGKGFGAVAYDPEYWSRTPAQEQQDPLRYLSLFAAAGRASGYKVLLMPGRDLLLNSAGTCVKRSGETLDEAFIRCGIGKAARFSSLFELQCAPIELDIPELRSFIRQASRQARSVNSSVMLTSTLSTDPSGVEASSADLIAAVKAMAPYVGGFQLNLSPGGLPAVLALLRALASGTVAKQ